MDNELDFEGYTCPVPIQPKDMIVLGHGSGGKLSHDLFERIDPRRAGRDPLPIEVGHADVRRQNAVHDPKANSPGEQVI